MDNDKRLRALWFGTGARPKCAPNPNYPEGMVVNLSVGYKPRCGVRLTYPAESVGEWLVWCGACGYRATVTAASRADDPREVIVNCRITEQ